VLKKKIKKKGKKKRGTKDAKDVGGPHLPAFPYPALQLHGEVKSPWCKHQVKENQTSAEDIYGQLVRW